MLRQTFLRCSEGGRRGREGEQDAKTHHVGVAVLEQDGVAVQQGAVTPSLGGLGETESGERGGLARRPQSPQNTTATTWGKGSWGRRRVWDRVER